VAAPIIALVPADIADITDFADVHIT